ncbi:hypothetical protein KI387_021028, partial [Taxus chinensis]
TTISPLKRSTNYFIYQAFRPTHTRSFRPSTKGTPHWKGKRSNSLICLGYRWDKEEVAANSEGVSFEMSVFLLNGREYYRCHDVFERVCHCGTILKNHSALCCTVSCSVVLDSTISLI